MYGKFFAQTFTGSMMGRGSTVFATWGYTIANAKADGTVELNPVHVAALLGDTVEAVEGAIAYLCDPDPRSRSDALDGRRLVPEGAFLYRIVNHPHYQGIRNDNERKDYMRNYMRDYRKQGKQELTVDNAGVNVNVNNGKPPLAHIDVDVDRDVKATTTTLVEPQGGSTGEAAKVGGNGVAPKGMSVTRITAHIGEVMAEIQEGAQRDVTIKARRSLMAEMVFAYWALKLGHEKALLDGKRHRALVRQLEMNKDNLNELLYVIDGALRDDHLMGRKPDSDRKYDGIETLFRDRAIVERLAGSCGGYRDGKTHPMVEKYARAVAADG